MDGLGNAPTLVIVRVNRSHLIVFGGDEAVFNVPFQGEAVNPHNIAVWVVLVRAGRVGTEGMWTRRIRGFAWSPPGAAQNAAAVDRAQVGHLATSLEVR